MIWRKQKRAPKDPTWIFSTWPIPLWVDDHALLTVTASDSDPAFQGAFDLVYDGPQDQSRVQQMLDRLEAAGGGMFRMTGGTYELTDPIYLGPGTHSIITDCWFKEA